MVNLEAHMAQKSIEPARVCLYEAPLLTAPLEAGAVVVALLSPNLNRFVLGPASSAFVRLTRLELPEAEGNSSSEASSSSNCIEAAAARRADADRERCAVVLSGSGDAEELAPAISTSPSTFAAAPVAGEGLARTGASPSLRLRKRLAFSTRMFLD